MLLIAKAFIKCLHWSQSLTNSFFPVWQALSDRFSGEIPDDQMAHSSFFPDEYFTCSSVCLSCGYVDEKCTLILLEDSAALVYSHRMWSFCDILTPDTTYYQLVLPGRICLKFNSYVNWTAAVAMSQLDVWSLPILFVCMATNLFCPHLFPGAHRAGINECLKKSPENSYDDFSCHFYYLNSIKNPKAQIIMGLCCVQWLGLIWFT